MAFLGKIIFSIRQFMEEENALNSISVIMWRQDAMHGYNMCVFGYVCVYNVYIKQPTMTRSRISVTPGMIQSEHYDILHSFTHSLIQTLALTLTCIYVYLYIFERVCE